MKDVRTTDYFFGYTEQEAREAALAAVPAWVELSSLEVRVHVNAFPSDFDPEEIEFYAYAEW